LASILYARHGQASAGSEDYDRLSALGRRQASLLGHYLARSSQIPSRLFSGTLRRHRDSIALVREAFGEHRHSLPEVIEVPDLNEFDFKTVVDCYLREHPQFAHALTTLERTAVYRLLKDALGAWSRDELELADEHRWSSFRNRVHSAAEQVETHARSSGPALVMTSGGVMAMVAQRALGVADEQVVELNLSLNNSALAEFVLSPGGARLMTWNSLPHLADPEHADLVTHY
jgi:broad specificity phosphatase PhoE